MADPYIRITNLRKSYQTGRVPIHALAGVDLEIEERSFLVVMGPSGSGKSTLLHLVGGLDRPTEGHIEIGGQRLEGLDENALALYRRRVVGFIFQSFNLIPNMSALENVAFPLRFERVPRRQRDARARELLEKVGLGDRLYHLPSELSGGEQQRVAIARALVNNPKIILADEPTGNLDTASGMSIMELLATMYQDGRTILVVTHDPRMSRFATREIHLLDGQVVNENQSRKKQELSQP